MGASLSDQAQITRWQAVPPSMLRAQWAAPRRRSDAVVSDAHVDAGDRRLRGRHEVAARQEAQPSMPTAKLDAPSCWPHVREPVRAPRRAASPCEARTRLAINRQVEATRRRRHVVRQVWNTEATGVRSAAPSAAREGTGSIEAICSGLQGLDREPRRLNPPLQLSSSGERAKPPASARPTIPLLVDRPLAEETGRRDRIHRAKVGVSLEATGRAFYMMLSKRCNWRCFRPPPLD